MEITIRNEDNCIILKLDGQLNIETAAAFVDEVREHIKLKKHIILNFENVSYISSAGIQSLYFALDEINAIHKKIVIANVAEGVLKIMTMMAIENDIPIFNSLEDAINSF